MAIVGGGFTGLWTAYYLTQSSPDIRVVVVEREMVGFGASGRNGGWCSALFAASDARIAREHGSAAAAAMRRALQETVDLVGATAADEGIDCHFAKGGTVVAARNRAQVARALAEVDRARAAGATADDLCWLGPGETRERVAIEGALGATYTPHCAALHPLRLAQGLAGALERRGVALYERTRATVIEPGSAAGRARVRTAGGTVRADVVVRALEAWTPSLPGGRRQLAPFYSLMVATEPLSEQLWSEVGLSRRETFSDHRHLIIYGQRTADGRLAFGGRGAPYHFGSSVRPAHDRISSVHALLRSTLAELFPPLGEARHTHAWGGPLGVPRDWFSSVGLERQRGMAWAGGYVGDGVSTTNLAGRTLADLILERDSDLVHLPWVGHRSPLWEPEPLRWLGANAGLWTMALADRTERRWGRPSRLAAAMDGLLGS